MSKIFCFKVEIVIFEDTLMGISLDVKVLIKILISPFIGGDRKMSSDFPISDIGRSFLNKTPFSYKEKSETSYNNCLCSAEKISLTVDCKGTFKVVVNVPILTVRSLPTSPIIR
jgi:hypothetical protein